MVICGAVVALLGVVGKGRARSEFRRSFFRTEFLCDRRGDGRRCWRQWSWVVACTVHGGTVSTGRSDATTCVYPPALGFLSGVLDDAAVNPEHLVVWVTGSQALRDELRSEDWGQCPANVIAKSEANCTGACEWDPVALGSESAASDAMAEFDESSVEFQGFGWDCL